MSHESTTRFAFESLKILSDAPVLHFAPNDRGFDRFGNSLFTSPELAYFDAGQGFTKAGILISPEGRHFLHGNRGILRDIEMGARYIEKKRMSGERLIVGQGFTLSKDRRMSYFTHGAYSLVCKLHVGPKIYVLKIPFAVSDYSANTPQPYINDMLQICSLQADLGEKFSALGVRLPSILFASGQMSCSEYIEGKIPPGKVFEGSQAHRYETGLGVKLSEIVEQYIVTQLKIGNTLWRNIHPDAIRHTGWAETEPQFKNFIQKPNGDLVWIDPIYRE